MHRNSKVKALGGAIWKGQSRGDVPVAQRERSQTCPNWRETPYAKEPTRTQGREPEAQRSMPGAMKWYPKPTDLRFPCQESED